MILSNFHTHTSYCDGKNTCEEMIQAALKSGFSRLGFSGHGYTPFDLSFCMSAENQQKYISEINDLKEKYKGKIDILCGIEQDILSEEDTSMFDYVILSSHYISGKGKRYDVDNTPEIVSNAINEIFDGDPMKYAEVYYSDVAKTPRCDIVGHFDLLTKFDEKHHFFDTSSKKYKEFALDALREVAKRNNLFEINTGAISRGWRTSPYPEPFLLEEMKRLGCEIIINSDCHDANNLSCHFRESEELLKSAGFRYRTELSSNGLVHIKL